MANFMLNTSYGNLGTYTVNIPSTDVYSLQGTLTLSTTQVSATQGPGGGAGTGVGNIDLPSQVVCTIQQNGSPILATVAGARGFCLNAVKCTAGDVLSFILSSSQAKDQKPGAIKLTLAISQGAI